LAGYPVAAWAEDVTIDTYAIGEPDAYPEFLASRVFQGSSGAVFPLPFFDHIDHSKAPKTWHAVHLENEFVRLMILPELGGRIQIGQDLTNGYDFFYRNNVIKPALVGLAGPWISGGVEFNWPQHHRPATVLPTDYWIECEPDGVITVWCSDHDPLKRMKGMHGVRLRPSSSLIELRVRAYNRTEDVQTFLWWSNVAAKTGDDYQAFFPPDANLVADHAKRASMTFPAATGRYYGVEYPARVDARHPDANRLDWYRNIPVPTSYMIIGTKQDFFGGYDHKMDSGFVYWADHRIAPGKKQWTWGNAPFGWAWDRQLTDGDGPYVELMAGAFTDNQPDFSFLGPGETKTFSQYWYPIQKIGPVQAATREAAVSLTVSGRHARLGVCVTRPRTGVVVTLWDRDDQMLWHRSVDLAPGEPLLHDAEFATEPVRVSVDDGEELVSYTIAPPPPAPDELPVLATAIPAPECIESVDELFWSAKHLEQYRHATRSPEPYLAEALRRDAGHAASLTMLSARRYRQGSYEQAAELARRAIARLTVRNPNPPDGEAHYRLGLALRRLGQPDEAAEALVKAAWDVRWRSAALGVAAADELVAGRAAQAEHLLRIGLVTQADDTRLRNLRVIALRQLGRDDEASALLADTIQFDPLDWWARDLAGQTPQTDPQTLLDIAIDYRAAGDRDAALRLVDLAIAEAPTGNPGLVGTLPLALYYRASLLGDDHGAWESLAAAARSPRGTCQLGRLEDYDVVNWASQHNPADATAHYLLGNWLYHMHRDTDAQSHWREAVKLDPADAISWRNLGVAAWNIDHDADAAEASYERARSVRTDDAKLLYEYDQLQARRAVPVAQRLALLRGVADLVAQRDDLTAVCADLATLSSQPDLAVQLLSEREFGPWEGGEGVVLAAWDHAHYLLAAQAMAGGDPLTAVAELTAALEPPANLGEARHLLANASDLWLAMGDALDKAGQPEQAVTWWTRAARFTGDFQTMTVVPYSDLTYYSILALRRIGDQRAADDRLAGLEGYVAHLEATKPEIDYFATSLPTMLLFAEDLDEAQARSVTLLKAQIADLWGDRAAATTLLDDLLRREPSHPRAGLWVLTR